MFGFHSERSADSSAKPRTAKRTGSRPVNAPPPMASMNPVATMNSRMGSMNMGMNQMNMGGMNQMNMGMGMNHMAIPGPSAPNPNGRNGRTSARGMTNNPMPPQLSAAFMPPPPPSSSHALPNRNGTHELQQRMSQWQQQQQQQQQQPPPTQRSSVSKSHKSSASSSSSKPLAVSSSTTKKSKKSIQPKPASDSESESQSDAQSEVVTQKHSVLGSGSGSVSGSGSGSESSSDSDSEAERKKARETKRAKKARQLAERLNTVQAKQIQEVKHMQDTLRREINEVKELIQKTPGLSNSNSIRHIEDQVQQLVIDNNQIKERCEQASKLVQSLTTRHDLLEAQTKDNQEDTVTQEDLSETLDGIKVEIMEEIQPMVHQTLMQFQQGIEKTCQDLSDRGYWCYATVMETKVSIHETADKKSRVKQQFPKGTRVMLYAPQFPTNDGLWIRTRWVDSDATFKTGFLPIWLSNDDGSKTVFVREFGITSGKESGSGLD